jgi:DNA processing protein
VSTTGWEERRARAALTRIVEPGDETVGRWLRERGAVRVLRSLAGQEELPGMAPKRVVGYRLRCARADPDPDADLAAVAALGGRFICPGDVEWPMQLNDLGDQRPLGLWVRGRASLRPWALRSVAVVGARACSDYGTHVAATLAADLAERGWTVVSGAAFGVDGAAHRGALAATGATIGVLASGVDVPYPPSHAGLITRIAEQGLLLSELPPGDHPTRSRFILRNRVIAALTRGTVVAEAKLRSGSLITARRAHALGRLVMGVPGSVTSALSAGVHELLRGDGQLVTDAAEVIELVGSVGDDLAPERQGPIVARDLLEREAAQVLDGLPGQGSADVGTIAVRAGMGFDETLSRLHELRALGFVEREGDCWVLTSVARG